MKRFIRLVSICLVAIAVVSTFAINVSATQTATKTISTSNTAYRSPNITTIYGQTMIEKQINVGANKTSKISTGISGVYTKKYINKLNAYVRFAVWVYDINSGKRVAVDNIKVGQNYYLPKSSSKKYYSVQIRPYIATGAFSLSGICISDINTYCRNVNYYMVY